MTVSSLVGTRPLIPGDIAKIVISHKAYTDEAVIYGASKRLHENMPLGAAQMLGYDPIWIVSKHADIKEFERNGKMFHNAVPI